jgi:hypothetical protein
LERTLGSGETSRSHHCGEVFQATLAFQNGVRIPLMREFLTYRQDCSANGKQDCELKAFHRLAQRTKEAFPALRIKVFWTGFTPVISLYPFRSFNAARCLCNPGITTVRTPSRGGESLSAPIINDVCKPWETHSRKIAAVRHVMLARCWKVVSIWQI